MSRREDIRSTLRLLWVPRLFAKLGIIGSIIWFCVMCNGAMPHAEGTPSFSSLAETKETLVSVWNMLYGISPGATIAFLVSVVIGFPIALKVQSLKKGLNS